MADQLTVEELKVEAPEVPGGVLCFTHERKMHFILLVFTSPCIGILNIRVPDYAAARIERWMHNVQDLHRRTTWDQSGPSSR